MLDANYTKIIATVGPTSASVEELRGLIEAGASCFRLNMSHGGEARMLPLVESAREAARLAGRYIPLLADIQGPKLRIGRLPEEGITLREGAAFTITGSPVTGDPTQVHSPYEGLCRDLAPGARIMLADGTIELRVVRIEGLDVHCEVVAGGRLYSNKGLNLPGRALSIDTLTGKDRDDLAFAARAGLDLVAISFVRSAADIELARALLGRAKIPVMAKLERPEALDAVESILAVSDGIMIARGDLGVELPFERVPILQKQLLERARKQGKWAVVATQMLGSMVLSRRPSRAEASDVVGAVLDGADAVMLSEETAAGGHPREAVAAMAALTREAEAYERERPRLDYAEEDSSFAAGAAGSAVAAAEHMHAKAIVTLAGSGTTALLVSKRRPRVPVIALGSYPPTLRRLNVLRGVIPLPTHDRNDMEAQLALVDRQLLQAGSAAVGEVLVVAAALPLGAGKETNAIRFHRVRAS